MSIFSKMKRAVKSKANAAVDRAVSPEKELDVAIAELEEQRKNALKELLAYKTTAKQMEQDIARQDERAASFETKAMQAVKAGDDELAKRCLAAVRDARSERASIVRDRDEAAGYAVELNRSRKKVEVQLKMLKLKRGTMATQIAAARSGTGNALGIDMSSFEKLDAAEERIDDEAIAAEVQAAMEGEELELGRPSVEPSTELALEDGTGSDALEALKAKMAERDGKKLKPAPAAGADEDERGD